MYSIVWPFRQSKLKKIAYASVSPYWQVASESSTRKLTCRWACLCPKLTIAAAFHCSVLLCSAQSYQKIFGDVCANCEVKAHHFSRHWILLRVLPICSLTKSHLIFPGGCCSTIWVKRFSSFCFQAPIPNVNTVMHLKRLILTFKSNIHVSEVIYVSSSTGFWISTDTLANLWPFRAKLLDIPTIYWEWNFLEQYGYVLTVSIEDPRGASTDPDGREDPIACGHGCKWRADLVGEE